MKGRYKKRKSPAVAVAFLVTVSAFFIGIFASLPDKMNFIAGQEESFSLNLPIPIPLEADFKAENVGVLEVNNEAVEGNIHFNLNEPVSVEAKEKGEAEVSLSLFGIPVKTVSVEVLPQKEIVPCGRTIGVTMATSGVMVLGTGYVNGKDSATYEPAKGILKSGDLILKAGDFVMEEKEDLMEAIEQNGGEELPLVIKRDGEEKEVKLVPVQCIEDSTYKIGAWVRDSTQGIGTITFYDPVTKNFGALGHGVYDVDTKQLMSLKSGEITRSIITGVKKGEKGSPGEIVGSVSKKEVLGEINKNSDCGLYGKIDDNGIHFLPNKALPIALQQNVHEGSAVIRTDIINNEVKEYDITIESINRYSSNPDKGMVIRITDPELLAVTNGIVQGMSGSPILQDGKVIGAVTHVFVQEPDKGYGIFIENMLKET